MYNVFFRINDTKSIVLKHFPYTMTCYESLFESSEMIQAFTVTNAGC